MEKHSLCLSYIYLLLLYIYIYIYPCNYKSLNSIEFKRCTKWKEILNSEEDEENYPLGLLYSLSICMSYTHSTISYQLYLTQFL